MASAGLWMFAAVAIAMVATGLPAWVVLIGVSLAGATIGVAGGAFDATIAGALPSRLAGLLENDLLQALPLYVFMGALLNRLPLADVLYRVGSRGLRFTGAGGALAAVGLSVLVAPMNGSVGASVAALTRSVAPRLVRANVPRPQTAALVAVASTLGVVVPPSLVLILLGDAMLRAHTEATNLTGQAVRIVNTQDVFRGALVPAALLLVMVAAVAWATMRVRGAPRETEPVPSTGECVTAVAAVLAIVGLLAAVTTGRLYAVEAAATGGVALVMYGTATRSLSRAVLAEILADTAAITGALFALLLGATVFTLVLRAFGTDRYVAHAITSIGGGVWPVLASVLAIVAVCALVLDAFEMIFMVIPVVAPPLLVSAPDATWVAVLLLLILQLAFLVPPFGYAAMMVRSTFARDLAPGEFARAVLPYVAAQLVVMAAVLAYPKLVWHSGAAEALSRQSDRTVIQGEARAVPRLGSS
jgi:TRAP-type mannitol/chloroaromatic compound transport system permease large subunit